MGGEVNVELKSYWRPSQSRKESILNCLFMGKRSFIYKSKGGSDQEISDLLEEGRILVGNKYKGVRTAAVNLLLLGREAKQRQPVWNNFELLVKWKIL